METVRPRLKAFAAEMLGSLSRRDQRAKGELYLRGLMPDGKRRSMQPMAERLGVDHQQLQAGVSPGQPVAPTTISFRTRRRMSATRGESVNASATRARRVVSARRSGGL
ncbi:transposase, partial [Kitasatospora sp. NPDC088346]|uniref:transposase n=1 Tax=Kitasatospora sp. NPDC088346 TaxID=3364073 RepID=UPI0037F43E60